MQNTTGGVFALSLILVKVPTLWIILNIDGTSPSRHPECTRHVDPSSLGFSLPSHRHSYISLLFSSRFIVHDKQQDELRCRCVHTYMYTCVDIYDHTVTLVPYGTVVIIVRYCITHCHGTVPFMVRYCITHCHETESQNTFRIQ
jgi:hypothetical protein